MSWRVVRVNDDGRREPVNGDMCAAAAEKVAAALRDLQSEADISGGWNVLAELAPERKAKKRVDSPAVKQASGFLVKAFLRRQEQVGKESIEQQVRETRRLEERLRVRLEGSAEPAEGRAAKRPAWANE